MEFDFITMMDLEPIGLWAWVVKGKVCAVHAGSLDIFPNCICVFLLTAFIFSTTATSLD